MKGAVKTFRKATDFMKSHKKGRHMQSLLLQQCLAAKTGAAMGVSYGTNPNGVGNSALIFSKNPGDRLIRIVNFIN